MAAESTATKRVLVCGIGVSAGGRLLSRSSAMPSDLGLAYIVVVHLAPDRNNELPANIARWTAMPVVQVADGEHRTPAANHVYVIAPDRKLEVSDSSVASSAFESSQGQHA
jgi:two-component system CheB/CheR fusion protein